MLGGPIPYQSNPEEKKKKKLCRFFGEIHICKKEKLNIEDLGTNPFQEKGNDVRMANKWNDLKEFEI